MKIRAETTGTKRKLAPDSDILDNMTREAEQIALDQIEKEQVPVSFSYLYPSVV